MPGASQVVPIAAGAVTFAVAGALDLFAIATSRANTAVRAAAQADLQIASTAGLTAQFQTASQVVPAPGSASFLLLVNNTGNAEDSYTATIIGTSGSVKASFTGLDGLPTRSIPLFRLPGLSTGAIQLLADMMAVGQGTVTVQVRSLSHGTIVASATATVTARQTTVVPTRTMTGLAVAPDPVTVGQAATLTTAVFPFASTGTPTGTVTFIVDGLTRSSVALHSVNGIAQAALTLADLAEGTHQVRVAYSGDAHFAASVSEAVLLRVLPVPVVVPPPVLPHVTHVQRYGFHWMATTLVLSFDEPLDPARAGREQLLHRRRSRALDRHRLGGVRPRGADGDAAASPAAGHPPPLPADRQRFVAEGPDRRQGDLLDGDGDGQAGGDYVIVVDRSDLVLGVPTPNFPPTFPSSRGLPQRVLWAPGPSRDRDLGALDAGPPRHATPRGGIGGGQERRRDALSSFATPRPGPSEAPESLTARVGRVTLPRGLHREPPWRVGGDLSGSHSGLRCGIPGCFPESLKFPAQSADPSQEDMTDPG